MVLEASRRIQAHILPTPLLASPRLSEQLGRPVWLKFENLQRTGSFKLRGAANALLARVDSGVSGAGVVACSSGNHGRAVAFVAGQLSIPATICVPDWIDPVKLRAMEAAGAVVRRVGTSYDEAEAHALSLEREHGLRFIPPFDDPSVIAGQGTVALEIAAVLERQYGSGVGRDADLVLPLSGGGLAAGAVLGLNPDGWRIVGVGAARAPVMVRSLQAGRVLSDVPEESTLASALSGGIGGPGNRWSFPILRDALRGGGFLALEATEAAIHRAVRYGFGSLHTLVEGGGATALAVFLESEVPRCPDALTDRDGPLAIVLSGGNIDPERLLEVTSANP